VRSGFKGLELRIHDIVCRMQGTGYRVIVPGTGYKVQGTGYRVQSTGYRVQGIGYKV
jgi:hypothetical protein